MTFLVPFDGSELAEAALVRATEFAAALEEPVLAVTVVPNGNANYARTRGWLGPDDPFDVEAIVSRLRDRVVERSPDAGFRYEVVDRYAPAGTVSRQLRRVAREVGASTVFVGSENAGRLVTSLSSVGGTLASDTAYDVVIVRRRLPATEGVEATALDDAESDRRASE